MPKAPQHRKRPWRVEHKPHQRSIDMSWFYNNRKWRKFTKMYKEAHPLCCKCRVKGIVSPTEVADHLVRYVDSGQGFDLDNLNEKDFQPLCKSCHDSKSGKEAHGYKEIGGMG